MDHGIVYQFETANQFWTELDDILKCGEQNAEAVRGCVDIYVGLASKFQGEFLTEEADLAKCCYQLLDSNMFQLASNKAIEALVDRATRRDDEDELWITYHMLLLAGRDNERTFELMMARRKHELFFKLREHIWELDDHRIQRISIQLMFEICRVQRVSPLELKLIDRPFLNKLLDIVEKTRGDEDEKFNYSIIKLILAFNEQFVVDAMARSTDSVNTIEERKRNNKVLKVLAKRTGTSKTFGENLIFMLNRADEEHVQILILKLLYEMFTTQQTCEFFYTNDLHVLVDVFIRELYNLPEESERLTHTYLRVLPPLLSNTQLRRHRYKPHQIRELLLDLIGTNSEHLKAVTPTTKRLVDRCLLADCLKGMAPKIDKGSTVVDVSTTVASESKRNSPGSMLDCGIVVSRA